MPFAGAEKQRRTQPRPLCCFPLTILQRGDVEWFAAVVSWAGLRVRLHHHAVVCVLPQVRDTYAVGLGGEVEVVGGVPQLQAVVGDDAVRKQRRTPSHVHLAGADGLIGQAVRRAAWNWRGKPTRAVDDATKGILLMCFFYSCLFPGNAPSSPDSRYRVSDVWLPCP